MAYTILGGRLSGPVDLAIEGRLPVALETVNANHTAVAARNLPGVQRMSRLGVPLAVVGGGTSITGHIDSLRNWQGDIWAINGAWGWCHDHDIDATFFAVDPHPIVLGWPKAADGTLAKRAILSTVCDPAVFDLLKDADVTAIDQRAEELRGGSSTAGLSPHLAALMGYASVTLFGCESSYAMGRSHAYQHEARDEEMIVISDGAEHLTAPDYLMQARELSAFIHAFPEYLTERSGGLLRALVNDAKADRQLSIKWISEGMVEGLKNFRPAAAPAERTPAMQIAAE